MVIASRVRKRDRKFFVAAASPSHEKAKALFSSTAKDSMAFLMSMRRYKSQCWQSEVVSLSIETIVNKSSSGINNRQRSVFKEREKLEQAKTDNKMKGSYLESILILTLIGSSVALATTNSSQSTNNTLDISVREGRRSNIAESCQTTEDAGGTCMSRFKCMSSGGTPKGFCGSYSVCCESKTQNKSNYPLT